MGVLLFSLLFILILIPLVFGITIPVYKRHKEVTAGIINFDSHMRKFVYKVNGSKEDIIHLLQIKNDTDELSCTFDFERSVMNFSEYGSNREYYFQIQECNGFSILRLEQVALFGMSSHVPLKLNPFIVSKLQAQIIPFSQYNF